MMQVNPESWLEFPGHDHESLICAGLYTGRATSASDTNGQHYTENWAERT
jgi:hypothetical protein